MACACGCSQRQFGSSCAYSSPYSRSVTLRGWSSTLRIVRVRRQPLAPVGELRGVIYRKPGPPGEAPKNYVHFFTRSPLLAADPMGQRLFIVGGQYRVTGRGIEG
jgi:hypothetical protein